MSLVVPSRRGLITGAALLVFSPSIVRAESIMSLRGFNLDPKVLAARIKGKVNFLKISLFDNGNGSIPSEFHGENSKQWKAMSPEAKANYLNKIHLVEDHGKWYDWAAVRTSELTLL